MNLPGCELTKTDLERLERSGIPQELTRRALLRRVDSREGGEIVGRNGAGDYGGIAFVYIWPGEESPRAYRLRRDHPPLEQQPDGTLKEREKYLSAPGAGNKLYLVPGTDPAWLSEPSLAVIITEGEKKCLALETLAEHALGDAAERPRWMPVGLAGVYSWRGTIAKAAGPDGGRRDVKGTIPDLDRITWKRRKVVIVFDVNVRDKQQVQAARWELTKELRRRGAMVHWMAWPADTPAAVNGVDDLVGEWGPERVIQLVDQAPAAPNHPFEQEVESPPTIPQWPDPIHKDAFHGVAGELVRAIEPQSEADPAALLLQLLVGFGNMAGRGPYIAVEGDRHHTNDYVVLVGISSIARKGTSWGRVRGALESIDQHWIENCLLGGVGSGEALIESLNDADHRRLVYEPEFARVLAVIAREGMTLSAVFRQCWDSGTADIKVRGKGEVHARGAHLSALCHVTKNELLRKLSDTELANGFANRFLFACVARSKELPFGGGSIHYGDTLNQLAGATDHARKMGNTSIHFDQEARALWADKYHDLTVGRPGLFGDLIARRAPHVLRLALNYALLDCAREIRVEHLRAALAVWRYCEQSALYVWGDALGDATADQLLQALRAAGAEGMTRWDATNHFGRNKAASEIERAIGVLAERGLIRFAKEDSGGRPTVRYWAL